MGLKAQMSWRPWASGPPSASVRPPETVAVHMQGFHSGHERTREKTDHSCSTLIPSSMAPATGSSGSACQLVR